MTRQKVGDVLTADDYPTRSIVRQRAGASRITELLVDAVTVMQALF